jgi:hypothetical protein
MTVPATEAPLTGGVAQVERALEIFLAKELHVERARISVDQETDELFANVLSVFEEWCAAYRLPSTATSMAAFLIEIRERYNVSSSDCELFAAAYLYCNAWDACAPVRAALRFCRQTPRQVTAH